MYTVTMGQECSCFKKSKIESEKSFQFQKDAYQYSHEIAELMNDEFCTTHLFTASLTTDSNFIITVEANPNAGSCGSDSSCSTGSCGC